MSLLATAPWRSRVAIAEDVSAAVKTTDTTRQKHQVDHELDERDVPISGEVGLQHADRGSDAHSSGFVKIAVVSTPPPSKSIARSYINRSPGPAPCDRQ